MPESGGEGDTDTAYCQANAAHKNNNEMTIDEKNNENVSLYADENLKFSLLDEGDVSDDVENGTLHKSDSDMTNNETDNESEENYRSKYDHEGANNRQHKNNSEIPNRKKGNKTEENRKECKNKPKESDGSDCLVPEISDEVVSLIDEKQEMSTDPNTSFKTNNQPRKRYICEACSKHFSSKQRLEDHKSIAHELAVFKCEFCGKSFSQRRTLTVHKQLHTDGKNKTCEVCDLVLPISRMKEHMVKHTTEKKYCCSICRLNFKRSYDLNFHISSKHSNGGYVHVCSSCGHSAYSKASRYRHAKKCPAYLKESKIAERDGATETDAIYYQVPAVYKQDSEITVHEKDNENEENSLLYDDEDENCSGHNDRDTNDTLRNGDNDILHKNGSEMTRDEKDNESGENGACLSDGDKNDAIHEYENNILCENESEVLNREKGSGIFTIFFKECKTEVKENDSNEYLVSEISDKAVIATDEKLETSTEPNASLQTNNKSKRQHICQVCFKCFTSKQRLEDHKSVAHEPAVFVCEFCGKSFAQRRTLAIHKQLHTDGKNRTCEVCDEVLPISNIKLHMVKHMTEKKYTCNVCGLKFKRSYDLNFHMSSKHSEGGYVHVCSSCGYSAHSRSSRYRHARKCLAYLKESKMSWNVGASDSDTIYCQVTAACEKGRKIRIDEKDGESRENSVRYDNENENCSLRNDRDTSYTLYNGDKDTLHKNDSEIINHESKNKIVEHGSSHNDGHEIDIIRKDRTDTLCLNDSEMLNHEKGNIIFSVFFKECKIESKESDNNEYLVSEISDKVNLIDEKHDIRTESNTSRINGIISDCKQRRYLATSLQTNNQTGKKHICKACSKHFSSKQRLEDHRSIAHEPAVFVCEFCGKSFSQRRTLTVHKQLHTHGKNKTCEVCDEVLPISKLKRHMVKHTTEKKYCCSACGLNFKRSPDLSYHMASKHSEGGYVFVCCSCGYTAHSKSSRSRHAKKCSAYFKGCNHCQIEDATVACYHRGCWNRCRFPYAISKWQLVEDTYICYGHATSLRSVIYNN
ncbi:zinc finger protein 91-like [Artemia franciscana]